LDTNYFEVVVCGPDLAGLIAAALLSRRGQRVLLCGHDRQPATFQAGPYTLVREPGLLPPPDAEPVARVMRELGHAQVIRRRAPALQPGLQIIFPQHRIAVGSDPEANSAELRREFPSDCAVLEETLARLRNSSAALDPLLGSDITLPPEGFWERRDVGRIQSQLPPLDADWLAALPPYHPMRAGLAALAALTSGFSPGDITAMTQARAFDGARRGVFRLGGGGGDLRALFTDKLESFSGEVRERLVPHELVWKRGNVAGLRARPRGETIGLGRLVWAGSSALLLALCGDAAPRRLRETAAAIRPACYRYTLCLLLRLEALPEGMGARVLSVRDPEKPILEDNALHITVGAPLPRQPNRIPVWVECLVPASAAESLGYLAVIRARVREELARLLPFYDRHLWVLASPHDGLPPELGAEATGEKPAALDPVPPTPMAPALSCDLPRMLGVGGAPLATGISNIHLASAENLPGLGREGDFVAAWGAARLIAQPGHRPGAQRREILIEDS
jgi:phytoene dehydrogenase-like protein